MRLVRNAEVHFGQRNRGEMRTAEREVNKARRGRSRGRSRKKVVGKEKRKESRSWFSQILYAKLSIMPEKEVEEPWSFHHHLNDRLTDQVCACEIQHTHTHTADFTGRQPRSTSPKALFWWLRGQASECWLRDWKPCLQVKAWGTNSLGNNKQRVPTMYQGE